MAGTDDNKPNDSESAANNIERNEQNEDNVREGERFLINWRKIVVLILIIVDYKNI